MDTFNEQQLSMCETNELVDYIAELRVKNDDHNKVFDELATDIDKTGYRINCSHPSDLVSSWVEEAINNIESLEEENKKLQADIEKLKNPVIHNRDMRCCQFDIRVGYSYIMDCLESVLTEEEYNHFCESDYQEKADFVCEEVARTIDSAINGHIINPVGLLEYHILDEVGDKVEVLRDSGHIYEEYPVDDE